MRTAGGLLGLCCFASIVLCACAARGPAPTSPREEAPAPEAEGNAAETSRDTVAAPSHAGEAAPERAVEVADVEPAPPAPAFATRALHGGACTLTQHSIGLSVPPRVPVAVVRTEQGAVALFRSQVDEMRAVPLDAQGEPSGEGWSVEFPKLNGFAFGRSHEGILDVVGTSDMCDDNGSSCIVTGSFRSNGEVVGAPLGQVRRGSQELELPVHAELDGVLYSEVRQRWGNTLIRFGRNEAGQLVAEDLGPSAGESAGAYGLSWLFTVGDEVIGLPHDHRYMDDSVAGRSIFRGTATTRIVGLPRRITTWAGELDGGVGIAFRRAALDEGELSPRGQLRFASLGLDGRLRGSVVAVSDGSLPSFLGEQLQGEVERSRGQLRFQRRDLLRRPVGDVVALGPAPRRRSTARWAFVGDAFVVVHSLRRNGENVVVASALRCAASSGTDEG